MSNFIEEAKKRANNRIRAQQTEDESRRKIGEIDKEKSQRDVEKEKELTLLWERVRAEARKAFEDTGIRATFYELSQELDGGKAENIAFGPSTDNEDISYDIILHWCGNRSSHGSVSTWDEYTISVYYHQD